MRRIEEDRAEREGREFVSGGGGSKRDDWLTESNQVSQLEFGRERVNRGDGDAEGE